MSIVITGIRNNLNRDEQLQIPGYNNDRPILVIPALATYNLFNYLTPDEIWAMQDQINDLVAKGVLSVTATAIFPLTPVTGIITGSNPPVVGDITFVAGTNVTITQSGASITISSSGGGGGGGSFAVDIFPITVPSLLQYNLSYTPITNSEKVSWNGLVLVPGVTNDYIIVGNQLQLVAGIVLKVGDVILVSYSH